MVLMKKSYPWLAQICCGFIYFSRASSVFFHLSCGRLAPFSETCRYFFIVVVEREILSEFENYRLRNKWIFEQVKMDGKQFPDNKLG